MMSVASFGFLALLGWLAGQPWFFAGLGMQAQDTATLLALFMLAMPVFLLPATPLMSYWSRRHEYEADRYAAAKHAARINLAALRK